MTTELYNLINSVRAVADKEEIKLIIYKGDVSVVASSDIGGYSSSTEIYTGDFCLLTKDYYNILLENQKE